MVEGGGFEPPKAEPTDLQSAPFDRSGTPPSKILHKRSIMAQDLICVNLEPLNSSLFGTRLIQPFQTHSHQPVTQNGARRGTRTHDLLILTHYRFRGRLLRFATHVWGLDFLFTLFPINRNT